jgi:hypothetical protein
MARRLMKRGTVLSGRRVGHNVTDESSDLAHLPHRMGNLLCVLVCRDKLKEASLVWPGQLTNTHGC